MAQKKKVELKINAKQFVDLTLKEKVIGNEDKSDMLIIATLMYDGYKEAMKLPEARKFIKNLRSSGFIDKKTNKLCVDEDFEKYPTISLSLMLLCGKGLVKRQAVKK